MNLHKEDKGAAIKNIRHAFFLLNVSLFLNYRDFIDYKKRADPNFEHYFNKNGFLNSSPEKNRMLLKELMQTQMIQAFFDKKMNPKNSDEVLQLLFFDESIEKKYSRYKSFKMKAKVPIT